MLMTFEFLIIQWLIMCALFEYIDIYLTKLQIIVRFPECFIYYNESLYNKLCSYLNPVLVSKKYLHNMAISLLSSSIIMYHV